MKRPEGELDEEATYLYPGVGSEEERIWLRSRVPQEEILKREGLSIFSLLGWRANE